MADNEVFMSTKDSIKFQVITRFIDGSISRDQASELLQMSQRSISRLASKVRKLGVFGVKQTLPRRKVGLNDLSELFKTD